MILMQLLDIGEKLVGEKLIYKRNYWSIAKEPTGNVISWSIKYKGNMNTFKNQSYFRLL